MKKSKKLDKTKVPPDNFGLVEAGVYRSAMPTPKHFDFLSDNLHLKTILFLSQELPTHQFKTFLEENDIQFINLGLHLKQHRHFDNFRGGLTSSAVDVLDSGAQNIGMMGSFAFLQDAYSSNRHLRDELIKEALQAVLNTDNHPILVCCSSGLHLTGTVVACLRRLQYWSLTSILEEYRSFTGTKAYRYVNEQFIELFDQDLISLPSEERLPNWYKTQMELLAQERREFDEWKIEQRKYQQQAIEQSIATGRPVAPAQAAPPPVRGTLPLTKDDSRPAYLAYAFCINAPLVSPKSQGEYTDKSLIELDDE